MDLGKYEKAVGNIRKKDFKESYDFLVKNKDKFTKKGFANAMNELITNHSFSAKIEEGFRIIEDNKSLKTGSVSDGIKSGFRMSFIFSVFYFLSKLLSLVLTYFFVW